MPTATPGIGDERVAYRGVFQRLFIRPEIGAMIGGIGIWVFFWAVSLAFGTTAGASLLIDNASTVGIMAVAVSMLMIGGEFDLSAGANTGAMGILTVLLSKEAAEFGGAGLTLHIAIPISLMVALGIGFLNGWLVEKTKLPSFTITLATYYVLIGAKLGFSKRIVDQIQVGDIRDAKGHGFWVDIFAKEWIRNEHTFESRDTVYLAAMLLAIAMIVVAIVEMHFNRRQAGPKAAGVPVFVAGVIGVVVGIVVLHTTDNMSGNGIGAAIIAIGTLVGLYGFGVWRFQPIGERHTVQFTPETVRFVGLGVLGVLVALLVAWRMKANYPDADGVEEEFFFPFTKQGFRAAFFLLAGGFGFTMLLVGGAKARRVSATTRSIISSVTGAAIVAVAFFVRGESTSVKFRSEAFSVLLGLGLFVAAWTLLGVFFQERSAVDARADRLGRRLVIGGMVLGTIGLLTKLLFVKASELEADIDPAKFSMRTVWFIGFTAVMVWVLGKTRFGSWTFAVGGNKEASRQVGVPAARTKTQLFMLVSGAAWLVGMLLAFRLNTIQSNTGNGEEFDYIIAAVVGGTLLTGGYGTALGGALGAGIVGMATLGFTSARWNSDWRFLFLGVILLLAMLANRSIRTKAEGLRR
jgi:ribose/xylose/arabinose/galactoside ABC-type transport system permease subunit